MTWRPANLALLLALGCEQGREPPRPPREPPRPPVAFRTPAPAVTGVGEGARPDAAATPDVVARCVARAAERLPPELGGALGVLGAQGLVEDACRLDVAPRLGSSALCETVHASALREACLTRVAIAVGAPERCPPSPGMRGRDPVCVAVAARAPSLCTAAPGSERGRCLALARADGRACNSLDGLFREACVRDVAALAPWLRPAAGAPLADARVSVAERAPGEMFSDAGPLRAWELRAHRRGQWLDDAGALWVADPSEASAAADVAAGVEPVVRIRVPTVGARVGVGVAAEARVTLPGVPAMDTAEGTARASAVFAAVPRARGDRVAVTVTVTGAASGVGRAVTVTVEGFVRDVAPAAALR
ncbi:MAG: hypothetical protein U0324_34100 [Polyangiales bacterium]